jgi:uncharacterized protein (DUF2461 family)
MCGRLFTARSSLFKKLRQGILDNPKAWISLEKSLKRKGYELDYSHTLARVPRGFKDVPVEIEHAIKLKGWIIRKQLPRSVICSKSLIDELTSFAKDMLPLLSFGWHALEKFSD